MIGTNKVHCLGCHNVQVSEVEFHDLQYQMPFVNLKKFHNQIFHYQWKTLSIQLVTTVPEWLNDFLENQIAKGIGFQIIQETCTRIGTLIFQKFLRTQKELR